MSGRSLCLWLFIFKGGQINFHPKTSSGPPQLATFPGNPSSGLNAMNCIHPVHLNCFLLKMVSLLKVPWEDMGLPTTYTFCNLSSSTESGHSFTSFRFMVCIVLSLHFGSPSEFPVKPCIHSSTS